MSELVFGIGNNLLFGKVEKGSRWYSLFVEWWIVVIESSVVYECDVKDDI